MTAAKLFHKHLILVLYISKLVVYLNSIINRNQIKDYLAVIEGIFCRFTMAFIGMLCRFTISCGSLLLKERVPKLKEVNARNVTVLSMMEESPGSFVTIWKRLRKLVIWQEQLKQWISRAVTRIGIWLTGTSTITRSHVISNHYKSLQKFQQRSTIEFGNLVK